MDLRLGMKEWRPEAVKLKFAAYLDRALLPPVPKRYGHVRRNDIAWQMLGNDQYGDCVLAGAAHEVMTWALATKRALPHFTTSTIVSQYLAHTGGKDDGLDPIEIAKWRVSDGLRDSDGIAHKVKAFAEVDNNSDLDVAAFIFGACGVGFNLPESSMAEFAKGKPWANTAEKGTGGHYVPLVGRNSRGLRIVVTWGNLQAVTEAFWNKYFVGAVAYFSMEYMLASGLSPEGIKEAQLDADLAAL